MTLDHERLVALAMRNSVNAQLTQRLARLALPECMLVAGCLFQAAWNHRTGRPAGWGVRDYDVIYFDQDLSWAAEDAHIRAVHQACDDLDAKVEVRNQARVHLWYQQKFGKPYPRLRSAEEGIDRYLIAGTCVGLDIASGRLYAPYGLSDLDEGLLRSNPRNYHPELFVRKAQSYQARWPWLRIVAG